MVTESAVGVGLTVQYVIDLDGGFRLDEVESMLQFDEYAADIRAARYCEGAILLEAPQQDPMNLNDALPSLVPHLCFRSLAKLIVDETVRVPFFMSGADVVASVQGGEIWLKLTSGGVFHYEKQTMMSALFDCGKRFNTFYARLWDGYPDYEMNLVNLEQDIDAASKILQAGGSGSVVSS